MTPPPIYPYRATIRLTHKKSKQFEDHEVCVEAYTLNDALMQMVYQLASDLAIEMAEYDLKMLSIGPDKQWQSLACPDALMSLTK